MGIPGLGHDSRGTLYMIQDPNIMTKILRSEGKYPSGAAELFWPTPLYFKKVGDNVGGALTSRGEPWRHVRTSIQSDLLSPASSIEYVPNIIEAAKYCSRGAPHFKDDFNEYLELASFDIAKSLVKPSDWQSLAFSNCLQRIIKRKWKSDAMLLALNSVPRNPMVNGKKKMSCTFSVDSRLQASIQQPDISRGGFCMLLWTNRYRTTFFKSYPKET